jgi:hypothetical protein
MFIFAAEIRANSDAIGRNMVLEIPRTPEIRDGFHYKDAIPKVEPFAPGGQGAGNWYSANCRQKNGRIDGDMWSVEACLW